MYANYAVTGRGSDWTEDDFYPVEVSSPNGKGQSLWGVGIEQHNVMCRKHVALWCGCSVPMAK